MMENALESDDDRVSQAEEKAYMGPRGNVIPPSKNLGDIRTSFSLFFLVHLGQISNQNASISVNLKD